MSRLTPYIPLRPAQKHVTQEDMWETLAKHAKPQVSIQTPKAAQSPKAKVSLQWNPPVWTSPHGPQGSGYLLTACGRYTVSKDGHELGFTYAGWKRNPQFPPTMLGCKRSGDEAKALCQADAEVQP